MATSEIITSTKYGPAVAVSVVVATNLLLIFTYFGWIDSARAALLLPTFFTVLLILYRIYFQHNQFLNFYWLKFFRNIEPCIKLEPRDYKDDQNSQSFFIWLNVSNTTYHSIEKYLILLFIPRSFMPRPPESGPGNEDKGRSTPSHACLKVPGPNEKDLKPISTSEPRFINYHLIFERSSITHDTLKQSIKYEVVVEGLVVARREVPLSELVEIKTDTKLSIKARSK